MHSPNLLPLLEYAGAQDLAEEINSTPRRHDSSDAIELYGTYYRSLVETEVGPEVFEAAATDFTQVDPELKYVILANILHGMEDEVIVSHRDRVMLLASEQTEPEIDVMDIRTPIDRAIVYDRLQRLGLMSGFTIDQDKTLAQVIDPENGFIITMEELLNLSASYDPAKGSRQDIIDGFNAWAQDPTGGRKVLRFEGFEGFPVAQRDLAMGAANLRKDQAITYPEVAEKVEGYLSTGSYQVLFEYVEELLFRRSAVAVQIFDELSDKGLSERLISGTAQMAKAYGLALAANGRVADAKATALLPTIEYDDYAYIHLEVARAERMAGDLAAATATLDALREVDPALHFIDTPDAEINLTVSSPLGYMNESIAEEYAHCGAFAQALAAYRDSRQYPRQSELVMADAAIELDAANEYFAVLLNFDATEHEAIFMVSSLSGALLERLNASLGLRERFNEKYPEIASHVPELIRRLQVIGLRRTDSLTEGVIRESTISIHALTGDYDAAMSELSMMKAGTIIPVKHMMPILGDMARSGEYRRAADLYESFYKHHYKAEIQVCRNEEANFYSWVMGWALMERNMDTFNQYYEAIPDYMRRPALFSVLRKFKDEDLHLDGALAEHFMRDVYDGKLSKRVAALGRLLLG